MKRIRRFLKYISVICLVLLVLTVWPTLSFRQQYNPHPLPSNVKKGVYHFHSEYSDGQGSVEEIAADAGLLDLDFAILTDHGNPNPDSIRSTSWQNNVLMIGGSELSLNEGHMTAVGYTPDGYRFPPEAGAASAEITANGGICFISHPFDTKIPWTDWSISTVTGIEIMSSYSSARRMGLFSLLKFPIQYIFHPDYALLNTLTYPRRNLEKWDRLTRVKPVLGIYCTDAHAMLPITRDFALHFPSYESMFRIFTTYVKIDRPLVRDPLQSAGIIVSALRRGHFFNVIEALAPANGFDCTMMDPQNRVFEMGDRLISGGTIILRLPFGFATDIRVIRNGELHTHIADNRRSERRIAAGDPGVYRVEIALTDHRFSHLPWILTNPFFIGKVPADPGSKKPPPPAQRRIDNPEDFQLETNEGSSGSLIREHSSADGWKHRLRFTLKRDSARKDYWVAVALRRKMNLAGTAGLTVTARTDRQRRFWLEIRTRDEQGEAWYRHSMLLTGSWRTIRLPFSRFHQIEGAARPLNPAHTQAVFISINNAIAYADTSGWLDFRGIDTY